MSIETNLRGRLRNTSLPVGNGLLPLFEAVVNSIHAIEDLGDASLSSGEITVNIRRDTARPLNLIADSDALRDEDKRAPIVSFHIRDNGIGFDEVNMRSFRTLDSEHKVARGGRGVGRLLWLKAFRSVTVESVYKSGKSLRRRCFVFDASSGVSGEEESDTPELPRCTEITLNGFDKRYRDACVKTAQSIANAIVEHCLWYFVRAGGAPKIAIIDGDERHELDQIYEGFMVKRTFTETVLIGDEGFDLTHVKIRATGSRQHCIALCAASRVVKTESLAGGLPGLYGRLRDGEGDFVYNCYVASKFLDDRVRSERTDFDILETPSELLKDGEISHAEIKSAVLARAEAHLKNCLTENLEKARTRIDTFVAKRAPRYRPILANKKFQGLTIDPAVSDKELELLLHKLYAELEADLLSHGHDLLSPKIGEMKDEYVQRLADYLKTAEDVKKSDLANYVFHRKTIIELLRGAIKRDSSGAYSREDVVHQLIVPMRVESNQVMPQDCNLWLIDERLAFHHYLASDKPLASMPITGSTSTKEPDILALNVFDNPLLVAEDDSPPLASIVVVEIKRPMRNDAAQSEDKDPIEQALGYLERVREGSVQTISGRPIPRSESIPGFCYVICDITPTIERRCRMHDAIRTSDGLGYFFYHKGFSAFVEILSFDRLVRGASERNKAFFDKLGLPSN